MSTKTERTLKLLLVAAASIIVLLIYQIRGLHRLQAPTEPAQQQANDLPPVTEPQTQPAVELPARRMALIGSQSDTWQGEWLGLAIDDGDRLSLRQLYRFGNQDPITHRQVVYSSAAAEEGDRFWLMGHDPQSGLPVLGNVFRAPEGTRQRTVDLVEGRVHSAATMSNGRQMAVAQAKDGFWNISVTTSGEWSTSKRSVFNTPGKELRWDTPIMPLQSVSVPAASGEMDQVVLVSQDPPTLNVLCYADGEVVANAQVPLTFRPQAMALYDAMSPAQAAPRQPPPSSKRLLLVGRSPAGIVLMELELRAGSMESIDRKLIIVQDNITEPIASVMPQVQGSRLVAIALTYEGRPLLHVRRLDTGTDDYFSVFPGLPVDTGTTTVHAGMALQDQRFWAAVPFTFRRPDGGQETALMAVDRSMQTTSIRQSGRTSACLHRDGIILWVVRDHQPSQMSFAVPVRVIGMQEGEPFPLQYAPSHGRVRDILAIGGELGRTYK